MASHILLAPPPSFDLDVLVAESIQEQELADSFQAFSLSPLTSPESSVPSSPILNPAHDLDAPPSFPLDPVASGSKSTRPHKTPQPLEIQPQQPKRPDRTIKPNRKARRNAAAYAAREKRRRRQQEGPEPSHHGIVYGKTRYVDHAEEMRCNIDAQKLPVTKGAYTALNDGKDEQKSYSLEDLVGKKSKYKFHLQTWDGSEPIALVDQKNRVIGVLAGHPRDENWPEVQRQAAEALESRRVHCQVSTKEKTTRRGKFVALRCGVSHGGGQRQPGNLRNKAKNQEILEELNSLEPFRRIAGFSSSVMATWAPDLHQYYKETGNALHKRYPELKRNFPCSVFCSCSYNFGPCTVCFKHKDRANLSFGMCSVTCFGDFDYKAGGHLVLWDFETVVEFPPGSTILLPSAVIAHSNTSIHKSEHRYSFAQYSAGGLFRWVENDFQKREDYLASLSFEELVADKEKQAGRLERGLSMLRTIPLPVSESV